MNWPHLLKLAQAEVARTLAELPPELRARAAALPVTYEHLPNRALQADGLDADTLGLFVGGEFTDEAHVPLPPQIILYLDNLWEMVGGAEESFEEEVGITFMHELGHYLGLDEDDLDERGLL